jgi:hypothetical protein
MTRRCAGAGRPGLVRPGVFRPARRMHEANTSRFGVPRIVSDRLVVEDPRHVGNRRNVPGGRRCVRGMGSALRDLSVFRPAWRIHEAKTSRLGVPRVVGASLGGREPSISCQPSKCARWSPPRPWCGFELAEGSPSAAVKRSQVALEHPALPARLASGAGRVDQTFAVIAASSRVCTNHIRRTTTLEKDQTTGFDLRKTQRRSKDQRRHPFAAPPPDGGAR